jgi:hypothetical protein
MTASVHGACTNARIVPVRRRFLNMTALEKPLPRLGPVLASPVRECIRAELSLQIDPKETTVD